MVQPNDRFSRQAELVPRAALSDLRVSVIGVGAVGRQVAIQLTAIGARHLQLIDFDHVDETNLTTQGYLISDVRSPKVVATAQFLKSIDPSIKLELVQDRYRGKTRLGDAVFCCVDSISAREAIWRAVGRTCRFWSDGRMLGETIRVLTVADDQGRHAYPSTLFNQSEAAPGRCTARSTIYTASVAAGLMLHQFARWLRHQPIDRDLSFNLLASELLVS
jgi:sulfur carrier protein ThiS adenylyltransferase